jgi:hypothetical protein
MEDTVTGPQNRWAKWIVGGVVGIIAVIVAGRWLPQGPECPNHSSYPLRLSDSVYDTLPLAGEITAVPEFHDCQRLLVQEGTKYGPLVGIWVSASLASRSSRLGPIKVFLPRGDSAVATVSQVYPWNTPEAATQLTGSVLEDSAIALALIYAWDDWQEGYPDLGIEKSWNCLYLRRSDKAGTLVASMVPVNLPHECLKNLSTAEIQARGGTDLAVHPLARPEATGADIPEVGRWDWDPQNLVNYIGLRCLTAWCEVTKPGAFRSSARYSLAPPEAADQQRVFAVKGWYDEQRLGERPWFSWHIRPSKVVGTVVPDAKLASRTVADFSQWMPAAKVALSGDHFGYHWKFGFAKASLPEQSKPHGMVEISLCHGSSCFPDQGHGAPSCSWPDTTEERDRDWWARTSTEDGTALKYRCVTRVDHSDLHQEIPATARWWWIRNDETTWGRCDKGCCTIN